MPRFPHAGFPTAVYEDVVFNGDLTLPQAYDEEEEDAEYDVYLFWPSTSPYHLILSDGTEGDSYEVRIASGSFKLACA